MNHDRSWLTDLFATHSRAIRAYAWRRVAPDAVDDVVAEVFARPDLQRRRRHDIGERFRWGHGIDAVNEDAVTRELVDEVDPELVRTADRMVCAEDAQGLIMCRNA